MKKNYLIEKKNESHLVEKKNEKIENKIYINLLPIR